MSGGIGRGAQNMNTLYFKPILRKAYHRKSGCTDTPKWNQEEAKNKSFCSGGSPPHDTDVWVPDGRTGIYYPKGQEKVMEDVPSRAAKDYTINWFSEP